MNEFLTFLQLGFRHITNVDAMDHILFLLALAAIYRIRDWRDVFWVVTAFTIGHSVTLVLAATSALNLPASLIEFLIPVTIMATCVGNLLFRDHGNSLWKRTYRPFFAGVFGLVHGAGFAGSLQNLFMDRVALPLFGFNVGIEAGQILVLLFAFIALSLVDRSLVSLQRIRAEAWSPLRLRTMGISGAIMCAAAVWAVERAPW